MPLLWEEMPVLHRLFVTEEENSERDRAFVLDVGGQREIRDKALKGVRDVALAPAPAPPTSPFPPPRNTHKTILPFRDLL